MRKWRVPIPWVNPVVVAPKAAEGDIRISLNMRKANTAIIRETLNAEKCQFNMDSLILMGMLL